MTVATDGSLALAALAGDVSACRACPRLVAWREEVARTRRAAYREQAYWARGIPGFGYSAARIVLLGLAPGAHGANRTGRMFTGDGSGDFLYAALHRAGLASQATSRARDDGLALSGAYVTNACRCAPPGNRPTPDELARCAPFLARELAALRDAQVIMALGAIAWNAALGAPLARARRCRAPARASAMAPSCASRAHPSSSVATTPPVRTRRPAGSRPPCSTLCSRERRHTHGDGAVHRARGGSSIPTSSAPRTRTGGVTRAG